MVRLQRSHLSGLVLLICLLGPLLSPVTGDDKAPPLPTDTLPEQLDLHAIPFGLPDARTKTEADSLDPRTVALGRALFFDPVLSGDGTVSCASCHRPDHGFATSDPVAVGIHGRKGTRNSPSLLNRSFGSSFFWDGRADSLEAQAVLPIVNPIEMDNDYETLLKKMRSDPKMVARFAAAFSEESPEQSSTELITKDNIGRALADFQRTLLLGDSPVDHFQAANQTALSTPERQGLWIFESRGGCWKCHSGRNYSDEKFHNTGVSFGSKDRDEGRFTVTKAPADRFAFKTPGLRGAALTPPYMHDGSIKTLREVVVFYNKGGAPDDPGLDKDVQRLNLSEDDIDHLVAFIKALSRRHEGPRASALE